MGRLDTTSPVTTFVNSGTIAPGLDKYLWDAANPSIDVTQFNSLTLAGTYSARPGAVIEINTQLVDDKSRHGTLVITETVDTGGAVTGVKVNHQGGDGALTDEGIEIIRILGTGNHAQEGRMFRLISDFTTKDGKSAVVAGAYAYWMEDDRDWDYQSGSPIADQSGIFLRNARKANGGKVVNPNTPLYESYSLILGNLNRLQTLEQRVGHRNWLNSTMTPVVNDAYPQSQGERAIENRAVWMRLDGGTGTWKPRLGSDSRGEQTRYDLDYGRMNFGIDVPLYLGEGGGKLIGGVNLNAGQGDAKVKSPNGDGKLKFKNQGLGATLTWYSDNGFYADAQARYNWYTTDINSHTIKSVGSQVNSNDGRGQAYSLEVGRVFGLSDQWSLTPQAQLTWSRTDFDSFVDGPVQPGHQRGGLQEPGGPGRPGPEL